MTYEHARTATKIAALLAAQSHALTDRRLCALDELVPDLHQAREQLTRQLHLLRACRSRRWYEAARSLLPEIQMNVRELRSVMDDLDQRAQAALEAGQEPVTPRQIAGELDQIKAEFGAWTCRNKQLCVTTDPITLEGLALGPFQIVLRLDELGSQRRPAYDVLALEPNTPARAEHITHPHVSEDRLCEGDAAAVIRKALDSGRLADFFLIVRSVLSTYNPQSAYVEIDTWSGLSCSDCGDGIDEDDTRYCQRCEGLICDSCTYLCQSCDESFCGGCIERCTRCQEPACRECLGYCRACGVRCCPNCMDNELCTQCKENTPDDNESEPSTESDGHDPEHAAGAGVALAAAADTPSSVASSPAPPPPPKGA